jgi:cbb3-type cytochrome oxidase maturation protein
MTAIYLLIPISLIILIIAVRLFVWAVNNKQFNNLENVSQTLLFEEKIQDKIEQQTNAERTKVVPTKSTTKSINEEAH